MVVTLKSAVALFRFGGTIGVSVCFLPELACAVVTGYSLLITPIVSSIQETENRQELRYTASLIFASIPTGSTPAETLDVGFGLTLVHTHTAGDLKDTIDTTPPERGLEELDDTFAACQGKTLPGTGSAASPNCSFMFTAFISPADPLERDHDPGTERITASFPAVVRMANGMVDPNFGTSITGSAMLTIFDAPEPASGLLLLAGIVMLLVCRPGLFLLSPLKRLHK